MNPTLEGQPKNRIGKPGIISHLKHSLFYLPLIKNKTKSNDKKKYIVSLPHAKH